MVQENIIKNNEAMRVITVKQKKLAPPISPRTSASASAPAPAPTTASASVSAPTPSGTAFVLFHLQPNVIHKHK